MSGIGLRYWAIAEGYLPDPGPHPEQRALRSHETACILNAGDQIAHIEVRIYFSDRDPAGPYKVTVAPQRTLHLRFDELDSPPVPRNTDYASVISSDVPIVIQHTRLDARTGERALISTVAFGSS